MLHFSDNDKLVFINICNTAQSMAQACAKLKMNHNTFIKYAKLFNCYKPNQSRKGMSKKSTQGYSIKDILNGKYPEYSTYKLKLRLFETGIKKDVCEICGWCKKRDGEKYSTCELHHLDGNHHNHKLENLKILCPNCHSLTTSYRSKNRAH